MSENNELRELQQEEEALRAKLAALNARKKALEEEAARQKAEEERKRELEKPIVVLVKSLVGGGLIIEHPFREDLLELLRVTPGRSYKGFGQDQIPLKAWPQLMQQIENLPHCSIEWARGLEDEIEWTLNAPPFEVTLHPNGKEFIVVPGPGQTNYMLQTIPGYAWEWDRKPKPAVSIPASEGWRIWKALENITGVVYSDRAQARIIQQVELRARLDGIAQKQDSDIVIPFKEDADLTPRPFQRVGVEFIEAAGGRVLLADEMGLGKTIQALGYAERQRAKDPKFQTIIICPAQLKPNWRREIRRLTGVDPIVCSGGTPEIFTLLAITRDRAPYVIINYDILGATKEIVKEITQEQIDAAINEGKPIPQRVEEIKPWVSVLNGAKPNLIVFDESHYCKNPDAKRTKAMLELDAPQLLPMTGTPVLNRPGELWASLRLLDPKNFASHTQFLSTYTVSGQGVRNVDQLRDMLKPMYLRRVKKDVVKDLPPINRIHELVELSENGRKLYDEVLAGIWPQLREFDPTGQGGEGTTIMSILAQIGRMKQVCAADKAERTADLATEISDSHENGRPGKVLIFSHFKGTAVEIARRLGPEALCFVRRTPNDFETISPQERDAMITQFKNEDDKRFLVVTEGSAKEGHNIECADAVIFNDLFWTPASHQQSEGRAYGRLSNLHSINSYYLIAEQTIEEWIMELLAKKLAIIEEVTEGVEKSRQDMSVAMELIKRMKEEMWRR